MAGSRKGLVNSAHKGHAHGAVESWWYENPRSIDVYIRSLPDGHTLACRIPRGQIESWLARAKKVAP
jgi:hypothetical protein